MLGQRVPGEGPWRVHTVAFDGKAASAKVVADSLKRRGNAGETPGKRQGNAREALGKTPTEILELLKNKPDLSVPQLAALMRRSESAIHRAIRILRDSGLLVRVGPDKGGQWKVIE